MLAASVALFILAALAEIGGGYLVWLWLREGWPWWVGVLGGLVLVLYGVLPTLQPQSFDFARTYAAYGGLFIAFSLLWGRVPDVPSLWGASLACVRPC
ncbi:YnfA family protein [Deinococcus murrayi]|uniref:YnfA family protein n=1 Tax=Deinococcus murrayi TaxID=68910 RepID=UPI000480A4C5|nr:YnfA family protein [Deinococcus murrayi]